MQVSFVRRIDDLGRIVIPKEIRKLLKIETGDLLDLNIDSNKLIIKKNSNALDKEYIIELVSLLNCLGNFNLFFTQGDKIIVANKITDDILSKEISDELKELLKEHKSKAFNNGVYITKDLFINKKTIVKSIIKDSNTLGLAILSIDNNTEDAENILNNVVNLILKS